MQTIAFALPVLPDKGGQLLELAAALKGPKREDFQNFLTRLNTHEENWYLQNHGDHDLCICYLVADDLAAAFAKLAGSEHSFDLWIKQQNKDIFGVDFNEPSDGALPTILFEFKQK